MATIASAAKAHTRKIIDILNLPTCSMPLYQFGYMGSLTYPHNGINKHTMTLEYNFHREMQIHLKTAEFVDILGNITDEFYGYYNDFHLWFIGKAARNEQFFVLMFNHDADNGNVQVMRVNSLHVWIGPHNGGCFRKFVQAEDMTWRPVQ